MSSLLLLLVSFLGAGLLQALGQLSSTFYSATCPNLTTIVQNGVNTAFAAEPRICASLLRLHFHDCFVNGCDASILLDGATLEQNAFPNINSIRGLDVIDNIKASVESQCPNKVSCADILALVARDCVLKMNSNGPNWTVLFGRRDSLTANQTAANTNLPPPNFNVSQLIANFQSHGFNTQELVALSGSHTVGKAQCANFKNRLYGPFQSGDVMDSSFNASLQSACPATGGGTNLSPLDHQTEFVFDNKYFTNLLNHTGLLFSDQTLLNGGNWTAMFWVHVYAFNQTQFFVDFAKAMVKMGNMNPLTGSNGEIRKICGQKN